MGMRGPFDRALGRKPTATPIVDEGLGEAYETVAAVHARLGDLEALAALGEDLVSVTSGFTALADSYALAQANGFIGTQTEWLSSLNGASAYELALAGGFVGSIEEWRASLEGDEGQPGPPGPSAYAHAVAEGFVGTLVDWLDSLKGDIGLTGASAYQHAVANGFIGTVAEWLESLKVKGDIGVQGLSAYQIALANGFTGTQAEWLESLNGADGAGAESLDELTDVDLATTPPVEGDALVYIDGKWQPGAVAAGEEEPVPLVSPWGAHRYWMIYVTACTVVGNWPTIAELDLYDGAGNLIPHTIVASGASAGTASGALDNNTATVWQANGAVPQWVKVDLGAPKEVHAVSMGAGSAYLNEHPREFTVRYSDDYNAAVGSWLNAWSVVTPLWTAYETRRFVDPAMVVVRDDQASIIEMHTGTSQDKVVTPKRLWDATAPVVVPYAATVVLDGNAGSNFDIGALTAGITLANPANMKPGQSGVVRFKQDATGGRVIAYGTNWKFEGGAAASGVLSTGANKIDTLTYLVWADGTIHAALGKDFS